MKIVTTETFLQTSGRFEIVDLTDRLTDALQKSNLEEGQLHVFSPGSTAGITAIEFESGLIKDLEEFFDRIVPQKIRYHHENARHDGNGHSHIRSSLLKTQMSVPFKHGELILGTWQQVIFVEFDNKPRKRRIIIQLIGQ